MVIRITTNHDTALALDRYMIGLAVPMLHATAGFCYLAFCPNSERELLLGLARASKDPLQALAHQPDRVAAVLERVRGRGFSNLEFPSYREGNVGVPLFVGGKPVGGLVMRYIKSAMTGQKLLTTYVPQLQALAGNISEHYASRVTQAPAAAQTPPAMIAARRARNKVKPIAKSSLLLSFKKQVPV